MEIQENKKIVKKIIFSESLLCFFAFQILIGIFIIAKYSILKLQNIIIDEYLIKIIDFSVSLDYSRIRGKIGVYMATEIIKSKVINIRDINKIDLYSLGVILYNLAFGLYPYYSKREDCDNYDKIYEKINNNELQFNKEENFYSKYFIDF